MEIIVKATVEELLVLATTVRENAEEEKKCEAKEVKD